MGEIQAGQNKGFDVKETDEEFIKRVDKTGEGDEDTPRVINLLKKYRHMLELIDNLLKKASIMPRSELHYEINQMMWGKASENKGVDDGSNTKHKM